MDQSQVNATDIATLLDEEFFAQFPELRKSPEGTPSDFADYNATVIDENYRSLYPELARKSDEHAVFEWEVWVEVTGHVTITVEEGTEEEAREDAKTNYDIIREELNIDTSKAVLVEKLRRIWGGRHE